MAVLYVHLYLLLLALFGVHLAIHDHILSTTKSELEAVLRLELIVALRLNFSPVDKSSVRAPQVDDVGSATLHS